MSNFSNKKITVILLIVLAILGLVNLNKDLMGMSILGLTLEPMEPDIENNVINLNSLTLKQKLGQMIFTFARRENKDLLKRLNIGGIAFWQKELEEDYKKDITYFQQGMEISFFVGIDLEGCVNPLDRFRNFTTFKDVKTGDEAYDLGEEQGRVMRRLGFNVNFSPVVDRNDTIWGCRNFEDDIEGRAVQYVKGLQSQGVIATAKHYPGKTLIGKDPHKFIEFSVIEKEDIEPFKLLKNNGVKAVMVNHLIVKGEVDSGFKPSVVSGEVISELKKDYDGLILTDEVRMAGLKDVYQNERQMYVDLVNAGNDMILDFSTEPWHLYKVVYMLENAVENGEISEERVDDAVIKILKAKGFKVKRKA